MTRSVENGCKLSSRLRELAPQPPRPLTPHELQRLRDLGFGNLARHLAAGTCDDCGLSKAGKTHQQICVEPKNPEPAPEPVLQPWQPRPPRHLRKAA